MNREELRQRLDAEGIRKDAYDLGGTPCEECLRLERVVDGWVVYYAERGLRTNERYFNSESEACSYLADRLIRDPTTRQRGSSR
jgi:hypothetical protein